MFTKKQMIAYAALLLTGVITMEAKAPTIATLSWGTVTVKNPDGLVRKYKDCKLYPAGSQAWDWRKTGTEHVPGIQISDLADFIDDVDIVILSKGMDSVLQTKEDTIDFLKSKGKEYHLLPTKEAMTLYNELVAQGKKVGALIHSTC